jgi:V-type H+-transporting ATPase subunit D
MSQAGGQKPAANRMTLAVFKTRLGGAKKGFSLLKKKRDALKSRFYMLLKDIVQTKILVGTGLKDAGYALAKAHWATGGDDITSNVIERARRPSVVCKLTCDNVAGVSLPIFKLNHDPTKDASASTLGLACGGAVINACRTEYLKAVQNLVKMASLQTSFKTLDEEIKMTSRRVNALEYVLIPRMELICDYINTEMDEEAREEFFRVKKVVEKKRQKMEKEKLEDEKARAEQEARNKERSKASGGSMFSPRSRNAVYKSADQASERTTSPAGKVKAAGGLMAAARRAASRSKSPRPVETTAFDAESMIETRKDEDLLF